MGSDHLKGRKLVSRCYQGACFGIGFLIAASFISVMFWILWCYLGLTIVQVSDSQRRAVVAYSYTTSASPSNRTVAPTLESSANAISRSATVSTTSTRTSGRGESPPITADGRKDSDRLNGTAPAKGDFADRNRANVTGRTAEGARVVQSQGESTASPLPEDEIKTAPILNGGEEDGIHHRRVSSSAKDNLPTDILPESRSPLSPRLDIVPTHVYDYDEKNRPKDEDDKPRVRPDSSLPRRDDIQSSRRSNPDYRDPKFDRDYPPRPPSRGRYDDEDDLRGSRSRYDRRDRGRDTDDRLSKGDTRVYPDDVERRSRRPLEDDRYSSRDRYDERRRGDEDRLRDRDIARDDSRYRGEDRYPEDRSRSDEDRRKDRTYEDRNVDRVYEYRYRPRDDRYRYRDDEYRYRGDEGRSRDDDMRRDKDYRSGDLPSVDRKPLLSRQNSSVLEDGRGYYESSERGRSGTRERIPEDDRYRGDEDRSRDESRRRDKYRSDLPPLDRKPLSARQNSSVLEDRRVPSEKDRSGTRDRIPADDRYRDDDYRRYDDRYRDDDYRRYDDRDRIEPTRVREDFSGSRSSPLVSRDEVYDSRSSVDRPKDRVPSRTKDDYPTKEERRYPDDRGTRYYDDRRTDVAGSRRTDPADKEYRARTSGDRYTDLRGDDIVLDRRSYASDDFSKDDKRSYDEKYEPRIRPGDDEYVRRSRPDEDEYRRSSRPRGDYDRPRYREDYDEDRLPSRKYDTPVRRTDERKDSDRYRPGDIDDPPPRSSLRDDDRRRVGPARYPEDDRPPKRDVLTGSVMSPVHSRVPDDVVEREKRYRTQEDKPERPLSAQEVIEAAHRHANLPDSNGRKVFYPVFDPRVSNLTTPEIIRPNERRGTTLGSRRRRTLNL